MPRNYEKDEPTANEALAGMDKVLWKNAMRREVANLGQMECWTVEQRPKGEWVMNTKSVLKRKRDENGDIAKYKARLVICENEEERCQEDTFSPVAHQFMIKLILCLSLQQEWIARHVDFENAFPNGRLERSVFAEMPKSMFPKKRSENEVLKFRRSSYGLKDAACT